MYHVLLLIMRLQSLILNHSLSLDLSLHSASVLPSGRRESRPKGDRHCWPFLHDLEISIKAIVLN